MARQRKTDKADKAPAGESSVGVAASGYDRVAIMQTVCTLMAEGHSLRRICRSVEGMPKISTICTWMNEEPELAEHYARARNMLADVRFDEYRDAYEEFVRQKLSEGWEPKDANNYARNATANMQWEISKLYPKKYGDYQRQDVEAKVEVVDHAERLQAAKERAKKLKP